MRRASLLLAAAVLAVPCTAATLRGTFDRTFDVRPGELFGLTNENGRITLRAWNQPRVRVQASTRVESRDQSEARRVFNATSIVPTLSAGGLRIETRTPRHDYGLFDWLAGTNVSVSVEYEITVPSAMNLRIENTNGGIDIAGVSGSMVVSNTNGKIECRRCGGDIDAETTNGAVRAELVQVSRGKKIRLESTNGRVTVVLPKSIDAQLDASTTNGSVDTELPVRAVERSFNSLRGTINGGGAPLVLRTTNGGISIEAQ